VYASFGHIPPHSPHFPANRSPGYDHTPRRALIPQHEIIADIDRSAQAKAKKHLAANQTSLAMSALRSKKALEEILDRRIGAAEQLRGVVRSIDQAKGDVEVG
jgi:hypothetical protein